MSNEEIIELLEKFPVPMMLTCHDMHGWRVAYKDGDTFRDGPFSFNKYEAILKAWNMYKGGQ